MMTDPVRIGLVGLGRAGWGMHLQELESRQDKFRVVAACDVDQSRCQRVQERLPDVRTYADVAQLAADPDVELVDVASRSPEHVPHALVALAAGKQVFLEKPLALSVEQARRLVPAHAKGPGRVFVRHNRRFEPCFNHIREILATGKLGDVFSVKLRRHNFQRRADWQTRQDCGGGQLLNWGPHIIDHGLRLLESPLAELWSDLKSIACLGDAEDHLKIVMKGENGRLVDLEISGGTALAEPVYLLHGTRGALRSDDERTIQLRYLDPEQVLPPGEARAESPPMEGGFGNPEPLQWCEETVPVAPAAACDCPSIWDHLHTALRQGKPFPISLEEALQVMDVISRVKAGTPFAGRSE